MLQLSECTSWSRFIKNVFVSGKDLRDVFLFCSVIYLHFSIINIYFFYRIHLDAFYTQRVQKGREWFMLVRLGSKCPNKSVHSRKSQSERVSSAKDKGQMLPGSFLSPTYETTTSPGTSNNSNPRVKPLVVWGKSLRPPYPGATRYLCHVTGFLVLTLHTANCHWCCISLVVETGLTGNWFNIGS
jgi:hypothetical protein